MRPKGVVDGQQVNIPAPHDRLSTRDAVLELVLRIDVEVPQGRDRFDVEASKETAEKNHGGIASARTTN